MHLNLEPGPILAVSLNSAWQKTLSFKSLNIGNVNRAFESHETGGGKGVNVARVARLLGCPVSVAAFAGGYPGQCLRQDFAETGVKDLTVSCQGTTRCCYTVIDREKGEATELIEPSAEILPAELEQMRRLLVQEIPRHGCIAICGSLPPGVTSAFYAEIAAMGGGHGIPVVLDAVKDIECILETGVTLLKINADELRQLCPEGNIPASGKGLLSRFPGLSWLAVTDGGNPAVLCSRHGCWSFPLPMLGKITSPIGGGDCATAIMARRLAETPGAGELEMPVFFAEALACASASCLTDTPSVFEPAVAQELLGQIKINRLI